MNKYFIGISISELQQWLADDELSVIPDRITYSRSFLDASSSGSELESLFKSLPAFSLDDTAGVLIVEVSGPVTWRTDDDPRIRYLALSDVKKFIPLTDDAKIALSVNWSRVIELSEAIFEHQFTHFRIIRKSIVALKAGNLFASLFIDHGPTGFAATNLFAKALPRALMAAEHRKPNEIEKLSHFGNDELPETWVERAFGDIKKYDKDNKLVIFRKEPENIREIAIVGLLFSTVKEIEALTETFREIYKRLKGIAKDHTQSLTLIYADPELSQFRVKFNVYPKDNESISLVTLGLFLRWKQAFHDQRSTVNAQSILNDVNNLAGFVDVELVANALWMMGAYLGMENITPTYRYLNQSKYPALRFANTENILKPVTAWQLKVTQLSAGHELSPHFIQDSGAAKTPEHEESALGKNSETIEHLQSEQQEKKDVLEIKQTANEQERAAVGGEPSTDNSSSSEPSSASDTLPTPKDAQTQQAQQMFQTDNAVSDPPERTTENHLTSTTAEICTFKVAETLVADSNHIQQAAPCAHTVSESKKEVESVKSVKGTPPAKAPQKTPPKENSETPKVRKNQEKQAALAPRNPTTISKTEGGSSADTAKPVDSQKKCKGTSESGKVVQDDIPGL